MDDQLITLTLPSHLSNRAHEIARAANQSVEDVLLHHLEEVLLKPLPILPENEQAELDALTYLSDDALWTIAREQMSANRQAHMQILMDKNSQGTLTESERQELEILVEQGQRLMLRKGQSSALLTERGHKVTKKMLMATDE